MRVHRHARRLIAPARLAALPLAILVLLAFAPDDSSPRQYLLARADARRSDALGQVGAVRQDPEATRRALARDLGWPEERGPVEATPLRRLRQDDLDVEILLLEGAIRSAIPAIVVRTTGGPERRPGLVHLHQFNSNLSLGKSKDFDLLARLARAGFVVIAIDSLGFEDRQEDGENRPEVARFTFARSMAALGRPLLGQWLLDYVRAIDYLQSRSDVDGGRLGAVGMSKGGWEAIWLAALDRRLTATLSVAGANNHLEIVRHLGATAANVQFDIIFGETLLPALTTPRALRIEVGDRDPAVPARFSASLYARMAELAGVEFETTTRGHAWGSFEEVAAWLQRRIGAADVPAHAPHAGASWLPIQPPGPDGGAWAVDVARRVRVHPWVRICNTRSPDLAVAVHVDGRRAGTVRLVYNEQAYLARAEFEGAWEATPPVDLDPGRHTVSLSHAGGAATCAHDVRLALEPDAAPAGLLKLDAAPWVPAGHAPALDPWRLVESLADRPMPTDLGALERWVARQLEPFRGRVDGDPPRLPVSGAFAMRVNHLYQATGRHAGGRGPHVAIVVAAPGERETLVAWARAQGWSVKTLDPRGANLDDEEREWAARTALQVGETLTGGTAADIGRLLDLLPRREREVTLVADRHAVAAALIAAVADRRIGRVLLAPGADEPFRDRIRARRLDSWTEVLPGLVEIGDLPGLITLAAPTPVQVIGDVGPT